MLASAVLAFLAHRVAFFPIDLAISRYVQAAPIAWLDLPLRALNALGFVPTVDIVYGGIIGILFAVGWRWEAMASGFAVLGSAGLSHLVKVIVERPRPPMNLIHVEHHITNPTFPAGHVLNFTALAGFLCYLTYARLAPSRYRAALIAVLLAMMGLMGLARIRAGEHWPSDVLGGYLLGVVWLAATVAFYRWGRWRAAPRGNGCRVPREPGTSIALLAIVVLLAPGLPILACQGAARNGCSAGAERSGAEPLPSAVPLDSAGVPLVPILSRYEVLGVYDVLPVGSDRADYSGITVVGADSSRVTLWLVDDKALRLEDAIYALVLDLPKGPLARVTSLEPARIEVDNEHGIPTGDDIEDIGWLPPTATAPGLLVASGERGPGGAPVSWFYLLVPEGQGLRLSRSRDASPPGETVENDGTEGVALRRAGGDRVELYLFKERPAPSYARLFVLEPDRFGYRLVPGSSGALFSTPAFQTQSGAAFRPGGKTVSVIDRQRRLIGMVQPFLDRPGLESRPREWINYAAIDSLVEGRDSGTPASLFGVLEGIAEDTFGRLYLLADNNEIRHSRLVILRSTKP